MFFFLISMIHSYMMTNYPTFENFRFDGKLDLHRLHGHSLNFMHFISSVIDQTDAAMFNAMLTENQNLHSRCNIDSKHMEVTLVFWFLSIFKTILLATLFFYAGASQGTDKLHSRQVGGRQLGFIGEWFSTTSGEVPGLFQARSNWLQFSF